jgi:tetratricopeptide (TPR) repeat protein
VIVAIAVRIAYFIDIRDNPFFDGPVIDAQYYDEIGRRLAAGGGTGQAPFMMPPLFPLLLSVLYRTVDASLHASYVAAHVLQLGLGVVAAWLTFGLGRRYGGPVVGLIAGLAVATSKAQLFVEGDLLATPLAVCLGLVFVVCAARFLDTRQRRDAGLGGLAAGLAALAVPTILIVAVAFGAWLVWRRQHGPALWFGLAMLLPIGPVTLHNWRASSELVAISANGGINFYIGNNPDMPRTAALRPGPEWGRMNDLPLREAGAVTPAARDRWFYAAGLRFWAHEPGQALRYTLQKALLLVHNHEIMRDFDFYYFARHYAALLRVPWWNFAILLALGCVGATLGRRSGSVETLLRLYFVAYAIGIVAFFVTARYRVPLVPVLAVFAAQGLVWLRHAVARRRRAALLGGLALAGAVGTLSIVDWFGVDTVDEIEARYRVATAYENKRDYSEALRRYDAILASAPTHQLAAARAAVVALQLGRPQEAVNRSERLLELHPDYIEPMLNLGTLARQHGDPETARHYFELAIRTDPWSAQAYGFYGMLLVEQGQAQAALQAFDRALQLDPGWQLLRIDRAAAMLAAGDAAAAWREIEAAARVLPASAAIELVRGDALARLDRRTEAVLAWRAGLRLDPAHAALRQRLGLP